LATTGIRICAFVLAAGLVPACLITAGCASTAGGRRQPPPVPVAVPPEPAPPPIMPPAAPPPGPTISFREIVAAQALLDRDNFSTGCADGTLGDKTREALKSWQAQRGLEPTGEFDPPTLARLGNLDRAFTLHVVQQSELDALAPLPSTWLGKSQVPRLGYETLLECLAEKYHASEDALRQLNPDAAWPDPPAGSALTVPKPTPAARPQAARVRIQLARKLVRVYDARGKLVAQFPCSIGQNAEKRPVGVLKVVNGAASPNYTFDPAVFPESEEAQALNKRLLIPSGPNNPVGDAWISLDRPGYGIHGTPNPEDIGKTGSHGCFRLANWNARKLLDMISIGIPVVVEP
jgi:lipoprotein-anchoring transpeptidase ErfK/SrfK